MNINFYSKKMYALVSGMISSALLFSQTTTVTLTSGGSWVVPAGVSQITVECWGGGGGGGRAENSGRACAGGGGGAYAKKNAILVTPGQTISYSIGAGGSGGSGNNPGGDTWFFNSSTVLAKGGGGVANSSMTGGTGGQASASVGDVKFSGGNGGAGSNGGTSKDAGGGGGAAGTSGNGMNGGPGDNDASASGTNGHRAGGSAGSGYPFASPNNGRGGSGSDNDGTGSSAALYGAGGGGGKRGQAILSDRNGGDGSAGIIRITYCPAPVLSGGIVGTVNICENSSTTFSAPNIAGATYTWTLPSGWSGTSTADTINVTAGPNNGTIDVSVKTNCGPSLNSLSVPVTIIGVNPVVPSAITGQTTICEGTSMTYAVQNDPNASSYTWTLPNGWTGTSTSNSITLTAGATSGVLSVVANTTSCGSSTASSVNLTALITPVVPTVLNGNANVCEGNTETYFVNNDPNIGSYVWTLPTGWAGSSNSSSLNAVVGDASGTISVIGTNACGASSPIDLIVKVNTPTTGAVSVDGCNAAIINGVSYANTGTFTQTLVNDAGCDSILTIDVQVVNVSAVFSKIGNVYTANQVGANYKWVKCDDLSTVLGTATQFTPSENGSYRLIVEKDGCEDTSNCFNYVKVGLEEQSTASYTLFPNPASEVLNIDLTGVILAEKTTITIVDMMGRKVVEKNLSKSFENQVVQLSLDGLTAGVYFVQITGKGIQLPTQKIVIK